MSSRNDCDVKVPVRNGHILILAARAAAKGPCIREDTGPFCNVGTPLHTRYGEAVCTRYFMIPQKNQPWHPHSGLLMNG